MDTFSKKSGTTAAMNARPSQKRSMLSMIFRMGPPNATTGNTFLDAFHIYVWLYFAYIAFISAPETAQKARAFCARERDDCDLFLKEPGTFGSAFIKSYMPYLYYPERDDSDIQWRLFRKDMPLLVFA